MNKINQLTRATNQKLGIIGQLRLATVGDLEAIYQLQQRFEGLDYRAPGLEAILKHPEAINALIENRKKQILGFGLGYPAVCYREILLQMPWTVSSYCSELNDQLAAYFEVSAIHPDHQRRGLYKILRSWQELVVHEKGFQRVYLHSTPAARELHQKMGSEMVSVLPRYWLEDGQEPLDGCLMKVELTLNRLHHCLRQIAPSSELENYLKKYSSK